MMAELEPTAAEEREAILVLIRKLAYFLKINKVLLNTSGDKVEAELNQLVSKAFVVLAQQVKDGDHWKYQQGQKT